MATSLVGDGEDKPALWPSRVRSSLQTAARTVENSERSGVMATPYSALHAKSSSSVRREPPGRPKSAARSAHSPTQRGATGAHYKTQRCRRVANSPLPKPHRRHQNPPQAAAAAPRHRYGALWDAPHCPDEPPSGCSDPQQPSHSPGQVGVEQPLLAARRQQQPRLTPPRPPISVVESLILRPESSLIMRWI